MLAIKDDPNACHGHEAEYNFGFGDRFSENEVFKEKIGNRDFQPLIQYEKLNAAARLAIPTPDHYYPLLYTLGIQDRQDQISFFNDKAVGGSLTMTSVKWG